MSLGTPELLLIFVLILMLFGPHRLPELARGLGKGLREFKKVTSEFQNQLSSLADDDDASSRSRRESRDTASRDTTADDDYSSPYDTYNSEEPPAAQTTGYEYDSTPASYDSGGSSTVPTTPEPDTRGENTEAHPRSLESRSNHNSHDDAPAPSQRATPPQD